MLQKSFSKVSAEGKKMSDFDIGSVLSSLSGDDMAKLKSLADDILGTQQKGNDKAPADIPEKSRSSSQIGFPDMQILSRLTPLISAFNRPDERIDFLISLKPLLSEERGRKADEAAKLIRLLSVLPLLRSQDLL